MKTLEELKDFYQTELIKDLQVLEAKRKQAVKNALIAAGVIAVLVLIIFGAVVSAGAPPQIIIFFLIGGGILVGVIYSFFHPRFKAEFKKQNISKVTTLL